MNRRDFGKALAGSAAALWMPSGRRARLAGGSVPVERWSWAMGQPVRLVVYAASEDAGYEAAQAALAELRRIEAKLSVFDEASDVAELNRRAGRGPLLVGDDLATVLAAAARFERLTGGGFNLAVEPLMRAWGFRAPRANPPTARELAEAEEAVRYARIELDGNRAALTASHAAIDTGGIAVGYALDRAAAVLRAAGISRALLDISGDCIALGAPPGQSAWAIEVVNSVDAHPLRTVSLCDAALATSANTRATVQVGRCVVGHVMDPLTGKPAVRLSQATAIARTGIEADALSTAMLVTGGSYGGAAVPTLRLRASADQSRPSASSASRFSAARSGAPPPRF
ncbi:MAG: FAD:protein FMN transferase [Gemmatimonadales bacterium]|nr:FAD:protein FMN transferase [Gemmatimonadales bacterium]